MTQSITIAPAQRRFGNKGRILTFYPNIWIYSIRFLLTIAFWYVLLNALLSDVFVLPIMSFFPSSYHWVVSLVLLIIIGVSAFPKRYRLHVGQGKIKVTLFPYGTVLSLTTYGSSSKKIVVRELINAFEILVKEKKLINNNERLLVDEASFEELIQVYRSGGIHATAYSIQSEGKEHFRFTVSKQKDVQICSQMVRLSGIPFESVDESIARVRDVFSQTHTHAELIDALALEGLVIR